jgi:2-polyprenyl-3-methyl-5-hydroxy-6-metoxy-1,4-benzoquinol methylase
MTVKRDGSTIEPQYDDCLELRDRQGLAQFGLMSNLGWHQDPKRILFTFARYKFVAKMFSGMDRVLEVGCADAFGTRIVRQETKHVVATDFDPVFIEDATQHVDPRWAFECRVHDMLNGPVGEEFDGAYTLDVLEHIPAANEDRFVANIAASLAPHGVLIVGSPSLESQEYASAVSKAGHVNCKTGPELRQLMSRYFHNVFIFSMNDEVVHTGFHPMAHYLFAVCCAKRRT